MAVKLYPPNIQGTIPAFEGTTIVVPFSMSRAVSKAEVLGFSLKIKTVQGSVLLGTVTSEIFNLDKREASFDISKSSFTPNIGQHYKIQIAYIGSAGIGYYSTVGVIKCTSKPELKIEGLELGKINTNFDHYTGIYVQEKDRSEKLYSSKFKLYDANGQILKQTEEILHNVSNDSSSTEATEEFDLNYPLEENISYFIQFLITTSNGYTTSTPKYRIMQKKSIPPEIDATVNLSLSYDDGYIDVYLVGGLADDGSEKIASGTFAVSRAASNDNYIWHKVGEFSLQNEIPTRFLWRDYTIEQGVSYKYSIQQYNKHGLYSARIESDEITADFEDAFLYDGKRQLKIRYNPSINSFKTDILENKTDTIGHKYPFIFRNGRVAYKEFPISGLISYHMDDNKLFMEWKDRENLYYTSTDLSSDNFYSEREFKLEVLDWLNNGEKKLFRSPAEGNYIVRLMNNSLSPNTTVGRMLHTFSSTAYEIAEFSYDSLLNSELLSVTNATITQTKWATIELSSHGTKLDNLLSKVRDYAREGIIISFTEEQYNRIISYDESLKDGVFVKDGSSYVLNHPSKSERLLEKEDDPIVEKLENIIGKVTYANGKINIRPMKSIFLNDMLPGSKINLTFADGEETIIIGATGSYKAEFDDPVLSLSIPLETMASQGSITYSYESDTDNVFNTIQKLEIVDVPNKQWIGQQQKEYYSREQDKTVVATDLIEIIEDEKYSITDIFKMRFEKRPIQRIFVKGFELNINWSDPSTISFYQDRDCTMLLDLDSLDSYFMYQVCNGRFDYTYQDVLWEEDFIDSNFDHGYYIDKDGNWIKEGVYFDKDYENSQVLGYILDEKGNRINNIKEIKGAYLREDGTPVTSREEIYRYPVETEYVLDGKSSSNNIMLYNSDTYSNKVTINGDEIDLSEIEKYEVIGMNTPIKSIKFDNGVICDLSYQVREITYTAESEEETVRSFKTAWETALDALLDYRAEGLKEESDKEKFIKTERTLAYNEKVAYANFIKQLTVILKNYGEINGTL